MNKKNKKIAMKILGLYEKDSYIGTTKKGTNLFFTRQSLKDLEEIEKMSDEDLISRYKSLVWINYIYGQVSLNELERISLMELEMDCRKDIDDEEMKEWYKEAKEKQKIEEKNEN